MSRIILIAVGIRKTIITNWTIEGILNIIEMSQLKWFADQEIPEQCSRVFPY